jgi:phage shock protein A
MSDVGMAIQRAEDKTLQLQARGSAIDELLASGALNDPTGMAKDDITAELERLSTGSDVDNQLEAMKRELAGGPSTKQLEAGKSVGNAADQGFSDAEEVSAKRQDTGGEAR